MILDILEIDFPIKQRSTSIKPKNEQWKKEQATTNQLYTLYRVTKIKTIGLKITKGQADDLIKESRKGKDIKGKLKELIAMQSIQETIM